MNQGAQHKNFAELRFQTVKKILQTLRDDMNSSIYRQRDTLTSLQSKLLLVENIVSFKPILVTTNEATIKLTNSKQLSTPLLTPAQMKDFIMQTLQPLDEFDPLAIINLNTNAAAQRSAFKEELLTNLQGVAISYVDTRVRGERPNKYIKEFLTPQPGDVCLYMDSKKRKRFAIVDRVINPAKVILIVLKRNKRTFQEYTTRQLLLLFRASEWIDGSFFPIL